jgi:tetratricopeptide (TPR) repeat protein
LGALALGALLAATIALLPGAALAAGGGGAADDGGAAKPEAYQTGMKLVSEGKLEEARKAFSTANRELRNDPDILNMLAYTQRKTGNLDLAIENYRKALRLRPDFPDAREYLGEAYLQAALEQLEALSESGPKAEEQHGQLQRALQDAARDLDAPPKSARW